MVKLQNCTFFTPLSLLLLTVMEFSVLLVGAPAVGKTSFIKRHTVGEFLREHQPTTGVTVEPIIFHTSKGKITLHVWEVPDSFSTHMKDKCYHGADAAVIMFSVGSRSSYDSIEGYEQAIYHVCGTIPIVLVGNKCDAEREVMPNEITIHRDLELPYYELSVKSNYNYQKPLMEILCEVAGDQELTLVEEVQVNAVE